MGDTKGGAFDISPDVAAAMLAAPLNPNGRPNSDVVCPWVNGLDIVHGRVACSSSISERHMSEAEAALYEIPIRHVIEHVKPKRQENNRAATGTAGGSTLRRAPPCAALLPRSGASS